VTYRVQDHTKDVQSFQTEIKKGSNAQINDNAADGLPVIERHLDIAQALRKHDGDGDTTGE
jgi:hypothetical protein